MNARDAVNFVKSPTGKMAAFCVAGVVILALVAGFKQPKAVAATPDSPTKPSGASQTVQTVEGDVAPLHLPPPQDHSASQMPGGQKAPVKESPPERLPISLYAEPPSAEPTTKPLGKVYAPFGRLIPCELIVTVDSARMRTPIIGLVTEDVYHLGRLVSRV